jgi:exonuclease SbcD
MRLLHTSDWHLGSRLHGHDRTDELFGQVGRVLEIAERERVDVLLVAGDIFECRSRQTAHEVTKRLSQILSPHIRRGLRVILLPGNHDDRIHFRMMRALLELEHGCCERIRVVSDRDDFLFEMSGVQFAALPYPAGEVLEKYGEQPGDGATGAAERNKSRSAVLSDLVRDLTAMLKPGVPAVFVTHINVEGVTTESGKELNYDQDINLALKALPHNVSYIALGHIHQQQQIKSHPIPCFYSGSFDRMDFGEWQEEKGMLLVDIPEGGGPAAVTPLALVPTSFYDLRITSAELEGLAEVYAADRERAFVRLTVERAAGDDAIVLQRLARQTFPRLVDGVRWSGEHAPSGGVFAPLDARDYGQTVEDYLNERFAGEPDLLHELLKRARQLIQEVYDAPTKD